MAAPSGATPKLVGFYWGTRGSDFKPRLGEATSPDGTSWTKVSVLVPDGGALFQLGNPASFDHGGQRDPRAQRLDHVPPVLHGAELVRYAIDRIRGDA